MEDCEKKAKEGGLYRAFGKCFGSHVSSLFHSLLIVLLISGYWVCDA